MTDLLDINVWLALADENHGHHSAAQHYWQNVAAASIAFCRVSMFGFLRLSTHPNVLSRPLRPADAWAIYQQYRDEAGVGFLHESSATETAFRKLSCQPGFTLRLWTDAYLAGFALSAACRLVSFDADFASYADLNFLHLSALD